MRISIIPNVSMLFFENQEADINQAPEYRDEKIAEAFGSFLSEAEIGGDHGYDAPMLLNWTLQLLPLWKLVKL